MKLILGLGNPGKKYKTTRHNLGFILLDIFQKKHDFSDFILESKFKADISSGIYNGEKTLLIQAQTFMNLSGESLSLLMHYYKIDPSDIIVIYDDISMDFGKIRVREQGSAGGHNGIKDIIKKIGNSFPRIKIGVGYDDHYDVSDWVLGKFSEEQLIDIDNEIYDNVMKKIDELYS